MIDEDEYGNSYHEHVQATTNFEREESATRKYLPKDEVWQFCPTTHIDDLKRRVDQLKTVRSAYTRVMNACIPSLFCEYCYNPTHHQSECPFILHYMVDEDEIVDNEEEHTEQVEHAQVTNTLESEKIVDNNKEEEKDEQVEHPELVEHHENSEPLTDPNLPSDMKVSTKALACITVSLKTHQESKASSPNVSKSHLMSRYSRIYAHKCENLGTIFLKRSIEVSKST
jgi:hypothetical protein